VHVRHLLELQLDVSGVLESQNTQKVHTPSHSQLKVIRFAHTIPSF